MRLGSWSVLVLLLVPLAYLAPGGVAQPPAGAAPEQVVLGDPAGDVELVATPKTSRQSQNLSQLGQGQFDHLDILKAAILGETDKSFQLALQLKVIDLPQNARPTRVVHFSYGRVDWHVLSGGCPFPGSPPQGPPQAGCLRFRDTGGGYRAVKQIEGQRVDGALVWTIQKEDVFNENRAPIRYGEVLRNLTAFTIQYVVGGGGLNQIEPTGGVFASDRAPQQGSYPIEFLVQKGAVGRGHLVMTAPEPIRVTNGEATTIVYKAEVLNKHTEPLTVQITSSGAQPDWSVRVPPLLELAPGKKSSFPVVVSLPFRHEHGKTALFTVEAQAVRDQGSAASTQLGVFWTDVPQPSGHHECDSDETCGQWFHSSRFENPLPDQAETIAPFKTPWFNGVAKDPAVDADDANVPAFFNDYFFCTFNPTSCKAPPTFTSSWFFPMSPSLLMGLDFDVSREGVAKIALLPALIDSAARVEVQLRYCDPTKQGQGGPGPFSAISASCYQYNTLLGSGAVTTPLSPNNQVTLEIPIKMEAAADLLPYQRGANIGLDLRVHTTVPQNTIVVPPRIEFVTKASHLHMPLLEYHDPIAEEFGQVSLIHVGALTMMEKQVNAGKTSVFRFRVTNEDAGIHDIKLEVQGIHADWARNLGADVIRLSPKQDAEVKIAVTPPDDAVNEERAELVLIGQSQSASEAVGILRFRATVVDGIEIEDEANSHDMPGAAKEAPGAALLPFLVLVAALLVRARRRQD